MNPNRFTLKLVSVAVASWSAAGRVRAACVTTPFIVERASLARVGARRSGLSLVDLGDVGRPLEARFDPIGRKLARHAASARPSRPGCAPVEDLRQLDAAEQRRALEESRRDRMCRRALSSSASTRLRVGRRLSGHRPDDLRQPRRHLRRRQRAERVALRPALPPNSSSYVCAEQLEEELALVLARARSRRSRVLVDVRVRDVDDRVRAGRAASEAAGCRRPRAASRDRSSARACWALLLASRPEQGHAVVGRNRVICASSGVGGA